MMKQASSFIAIAAALSAASCSTGELNIRPTKTALTEGRQPADIRVAEGNAQLAADINWLLQNVRWDVAADLERLFGPALAHSLHRLGSALAKGLRSATLGAVGVAERMRPTP